MNTRDHGLILTCEHASHAIPNHYAEVAHRARAALKTHRGYDPGTLELGRRLAGAFKADLFAGKVSRLLVELNRSLGHPGLWSEFSRALSREQKAAVLGEYYLPYRQGVEKRLAAIIGEGQIAWHLSLHSFTPRLHGEVRRADIGLLYDPRRPLEKAWAARWRQALKSHDSSLKVRRNYPYLGTADGFTTHLRKVFAPDRYAGLELEINQKWVRGKRPEWEHMKRLVQRALAEIGTSHPAC